MNSKSMILFAMAAAAFAQTNMKVRFGDGTGLDIHTESTGSNLPVSTSGSHVVPAGFDYHRVVFDKQGALLLGYDIEARKAGQGTYTVRIKPVDTDKIKVGGLGKWLEIPTLTGVRDSRRCGQAMRGSGYSLHPQRREDLRRSEGGGRAAAGARRTGNPPASFRWKTST